jgi:hypothetical protein
MVQRGTGVSDESKAWWALPRTVPAIQFASDPLHVRVSDGLSDWDDEPVSVAEHVRHLNHDWKILAYLADSATR